MTPRPWAMAMTTSRHLRYSYLMEQRIQAVYRNGVFEPIEARALEEGQNVVLTVAGEPAYDSFARGFFTQEEWDQARQDTITHEEVRRALANMKGSFAEAVNEERNER